MATTTSPPPAFVNTTAPRGAVAEVVTADRHPLTGAAVVRVEGGDDVAEVVPHRRADGERPLPQGARRPAGTTALAQRLGRAQQVGRDAGQAGDLRPVDAPAERGIGDRDRVGQQVAHQLPGRRRRRRHAHEVAEQVAPVAVALVVEPAGRREHGGRDEPRRERGGLELGERWGRVGAEQVDHRVGPRRLAVDEPGDGVGEHRVVDGRPEGPGPDVVGKAQPSRPGRPVGRLLAELGAQTGGRRATARPPPPFT